MRRGVCFGHRTLRTCVSKGRFKQITYPPPNSMKIKGVHPSITSICKPVMQWFKDLHRACVNSSVLASVASSGLTAPRHGLILLHAIAIMSDYINGNTWTNAFDLNLIWGKGLIRNRHFMYSWRIELCMASETR